MAMKQDAFSAICDCENKVHEAFKRYSTNQQDLGNTLGDIQTEFGKEVFLTAMINCLKIAYVRLYGPPN